jgi:hypothetical protein
MDVNESDLRKLGQCFDTGIYTAMKVAAAWSAASKHGSEGGSMSLCLYAAMNTYIYSSFRLLLSMERAIKNTLGDPPSV